MTEKPELDPLDGLLRDALSRQLDPHLGQASAKFDRFAEPRAPTSSGSRHWWTIPLLAPLFAAAAAVTLIAVPLLRHIEPVPDRGHAAAASKLAGTEQSLLAPVQIEPVGTAQAIAFEPKDVEGRVQWATRDEGQVWLDDETPARKLRRQRWETILWTDPRDQSRIEISVPREEVLLVSSPRF